MSNFLVGGWRKLVANRTVWSLGDQGMVSAGNFAVNIILARNVSTADFGTYALVFTFFLFINGLHGSFVNYPMTLKIAKAGKESVAHLVGLSMVLTSLVMPLLWIPIIVLFIVLERPELIPAGLLAMTAWRFQDVARRALMSELRHRDAVPGDAISYLGQAAAMVMLVHFELLSLHYVFLVMAMTSALAAVFQIVQVGVRFSVWEGLRPFAIDCWELGRWVVMRRLTSVVQSNGLGWVLAAAHGLEATASFRAAVNVLAVSHPFMMGIGNLMIPSVAHAHREGIGSVKRVTWSLGLQGAAIVFPYFIFLSFVPDYALGLIYGPESPYRDLGVVLSIMVLGYAIHYVSRILSGTLAGLAKPKLTFQAQLYGTIAAIFVSLPMAALGGIFYAAIGAAFAHAVRMVASLIFLRREIQRESAASTS